MNGRCILHKLFDSQTIQLHLNFNINKKCQYYKVIYLPWSKSLSYIAHNLVIKYEHFLKVLIVSRWHMAFPGAILKSQHWYSPGFMNRGVLETIFDTLFRY